MGDRSCSVSSFFFNAPASTEIYTLSLHDALPIWMLAHLELVLVYFSGMLSRVICAASQDRKSTRLNSSHSQISYAVFCLKKKKNNTLVIGDAGIKSTIQGSNVPPPAEAVPNFISG